MSNRRVPQSKVGDQNEVPHRPVTRSQTNKVTERTNTKVQGDAPRLYPELSELTDDDEVSTDEKVEGDEKKQSNRTHPANQRKVPTVVPEYDRPLPPPRSRANSSNAQSVSQSANQQASSHGAICKSVLALIVVGLAVWIAGEYFPETKAKVILKYSRSKDQLADLMKQLTISEMELKRENFQRLLTTAEFNDNLPAFGKSVLKVIFEKATSSSRNSPAVLLLIASADQSEHVRNISRRLANLITTGDYDSATNASFQIKPGHTQKDIEQFYSQVFEQRKQPVLLLEDLEQLNPSEAIVFHQFMDGEVSKCPNSFVIITLKYTQPLTVGLNVTQRQLSDISADILENLWKGALTKESMDCVINRIAEYAVVLVNNNK